jgi:hypothetical protein
MLPLERQYKMYIPHVLEKAQKSLPDDGFASFSNFIRREKEAHSKQENSLNDYLGTIWASLALYPGRTSQLFTEKSEFVIEEVKQLASCFSIQKHQATWWIIETCSYSIKDIEKADWVANFIMANEPEAATIGINNLTVMARHPYSRSPAVIRAICRIMIGAEISLEEMQSALAHALKETI